MEEHEIHTQYTGHDLLDLNGDKIGTITDVRYGELTGGLTWLVVKTGLLGTKRVLVPAIEVRSSGGSLVASFTKDRVKHSPEVEEDSPRREGEERELCMYYGLEYSSSPYAPVEGCTDEEEQRHVA